MAQSIILKRSATSGKVPTTSSLSLGELAVNTYDGKIFFKKSGSIESIETIVTTNSVTTGSLTLTGDVTVLGAINARQFNIGIISSSILYQSGSNKFGDTSDDTHQFTGSATITGSLTMTGPISASINNLYNIGTPSFRFNQIFLGGAIYLSNSGVKGNALTFGDETGVIFMKIGSLVTGGNIGIYGSGSTYVDNGSRLQILASGSQNALYVSGSSVFTGSIIQSGSLTSIGPSTFIGNITQTGSLSVSGDVTVLGSINARQFNIGVISSSIMYTSGSNKFGDTLDDTHQFTGSVTITGSIYVNGTAVGVAPGPNTYDFNLDPSAAGTVNYIQDSTGNSFVIAQTGSIDIKVNNSTFLSVSQSAINVTTGSITANYMHLAKYISTAGDLDFNI